MAYTPPLNGGRVNLTLAGNSTSAGAGYALASTGTVTLAGGNNITLSQNGNAITISGGAGGAGGVALANSQTTYSSGTVNLLEGGGAITIASGANQSFNVSVPQTSSLSATGQVSISTNGSTISIGAPDQTNQTLSYAMSSQTVGNTSGMSVDARSLTHVGRGMISVGASTSAGGSSLIFSATQSVQPGIASIQASNTTYTSGNVIFSNANGISFGSSAGSAITASYTVPTQTVQPGIASIQASNTTYTSGKVIFSNANNISFGSSAGSVITASFGGGGGVALYDGANSITSGTASLADGNGVSLGINGQTVTASVANMFNAGMSTNGNTAGTTGTVSNQLIFVGGNNITLSQSTGAGGNTLSISAPNFATATSPFQIQFAGNTSGAMSTITTGAVQFAGGNNVTLSQTQQSITISAGPVAVSTYIPDNMWAASTASQVIGGAVGVTSASALFFPISLSNSVYFDALRMLGFFSWATSSASGAQTVSSMFGLYSNNASTLSSISTGSFSLAATNSSVSATLSYPSATGTAGYTYTTNAATTTAQIHSLFGTAAPGRQIDLQFGNTMSLAPGLYWLGVINRQTTANAAVGVSAAIVGNAIAPQANFALIGEGSTVSTTNVTLRASVLQGFGPYTSTGSAGYGGTTLPGSVFLTGIAHTASIMPLLTFIST